MSYPDPDPNSGPDPHGVVGTKDSNRSNSAEQKQIVSCLLSLIDGVRDGAKNGATDGTKDGGRRNNSIFIIATSSKPNNIDQAMRRPGKPWTLDLLDSMTYGSWRCP